VDVGALIFLSDLKFAEGFLMNRLFRTLNNRSSAATLSSRPPDRRRSKQVLLRSAATARPTVEPLEDRQMLSLTVDLRVFGSSTPKSATVSSVGQVITLQEWVTVTGSEPGSDDGIQSVTGSALSTKTSSTESVNGNLAAELTPTYTADGSQNGTPTDLNGDGNLDVGSNNNGDIAGFINARAGGLVTTGGDISGDSQSWVVATMTYKVTSLSYGQATDINFRFRNGVPAGAFDAVWWEDGHGENDQMGTVAVGAPVVITDPNLSPPVMGTISGTVYKSASGSTSDFAGQTVYLDLGDTGSYVSGDPSVVTSSLGSYSFTNVAAGTYYLRQIVPTGYTQTSPTTSPTTITINSGATSFTGENFTDTAASTSGGSGSASLLKGTVIGTSGSWDNGGYVIANAFDGNLSTDFVGPTANGDWAGLNLGAEYTISQVKYSPQPGDSSRMVGGIFQGSNSPTFSSGVTNLYTITSAPTAGVYTTANITSTTSFEYVRYLGPNGSYGDVAELQFYGTYTGAATGGGGGGTTGSSALTGTVIGTSGSWSNDGNTISKALDGSLSTYFDGPTANGDWAGLNLGTTYAITSISYSPRSGWASRMVGGTFQGSNSATFSSGVVNLFTITSTPATGSFTTVSISNTSAFQYVRYIGANGSYGDVAEIQFFGNKSSNVTGSGPTKLTGSVIGTSGSYDNSGNTISKAVDGNLSTFFDGPTANGDWVGLNLGSAQTIGQISYAPRSGWASRMVGGTFQASNSATFSSGVVNLFTITSTPATGSLTTVTVNVSGTYQYVRYIAPNGSYGDVAEINFYS
jgi:hypothetical protein